MVLFTKEMLSEKKKTQDINSMYYTIHIDTFHMYILSLYMYVYCSMGCPGSSDGKEPTCNMGDLGSISGLGRSPEESMATHSSILAWRSPWTEEPGGLQGGHNHGVPKS